MKTIIDNIFGRIDDYDLQIPKLTLDLEDSLEKEALENGWAIYESKWYTSRMVRLNLNRYNKKSKQLKNYEFSFHERIEDLTEISRVFDIFVSLKNLNPLYDITLDKDRSSWMLVHWDGELVAFTKFINYDGEMESQFTAWDYSDPKASIGTRIVEHEISVARSKGLEYLYIGPGYGDVAIYKSKFDGFEWWTGREWSTDKDKYNELCNRDMTINTLSDLSKLILEK